MKITQIKSGDVLFVWGKSFIDEAIEFVTHGASHCALFLDNQFVAEAQGGRVIGTTLVSDYLNLDNHLEIWRDEILTEQDRTNMVSYAKNQFGTQYDYLAIIAELARFELDISIDHFHEGKRRICSSYVNDIAMSVGHNWSNATHTPAPIDLLNSGKLTRIGILK